MCVCATQGSGIKHLDVLENATKEPSRHVADQIADGSVRWVGVVTDTGLPTGKPIVQVEGDPCPGAYVSASALGDHTKGDKSPWRYVDAATIPYFSVPPGVIKLGVQLGDVGVVSYNGKTANIVIADVGPAKKLGEGSVALAKSLGIPSSPVNGGTDKGLHVKVWPGSSKGWPRTQEDIAAQIVELQTKT